MKHPYVELLNSFSLSPRSRTLLDLKSYYVLHWQFSHLLKQLKDDGQLEHNGVLYVPVWKNRGTVTGIHIEDMNKQMMLSFRELKNPLFPPIVLIKDKEY